MISFSQFLLENPVGINDPEFKVYIPQEGEETNVVYVPAYDYDDGTKEAFVGYFRLVNVDDHVCWVVVPERKLARKIEFREIIYRPEIPDNAKTEVRFDEAMNAWNSAPKEIKK